jgi:dTDP-4-dehydrorhamnose reductase
MISKIYITGCGGMLGEAFYKQFNDDYILSCTDKNVNEPWLSFLDFRDFSAFRKDVFDFQPDYLFHLGAFTDLEFCEINPEATYRNNTSAVKAVVEIANNLDIPILYISTAGIFNGEKEYYTEWDIPDPLGVYANSKYLAEKYVIENAARYLVCRAGWMMGGGPWKDKKFIQKIMKQIGEGAKEIHVVTDKNGTPTYTHDFARNVKLLIEDGVSGLFNMVCEGQTSRYEIATELIKILGIDIKIIPVDSSYFKEYFAPRPACERLINKNLNSLGLNIMRDWQVALREYIEIYYL